MDDQIVMPEAEVQATPQVGMLARFIAVFFDPRKAFSSVRKNWEWLVVVLIVSLFGLGSYQFTKPIVVKDQMAQLEKQLDSYDLPEDRKQEIMDSARERMGNPVWQLLTPVVVTIVLVIGAGILLFLGNIILGGQTSYKLVLNMFALSFLIGIPDTIIKLPLILSKGSTAVHTSLALLVSPEQANTFIGGLLGKFDLFGLWQVGLVILGMSILTKSSVAKSAWTVGAAWFVWALIQAGLISLGLNFGGM